MTSPRTPRRADDVGRSTPRLLALVAAGGAVGALARHGVGRLGAHDPADFPLGTFTVNVTGAFALGVLLAVLAGTSSRRVLRPLLATGFLGAYTTFSTYAVEIVTRVRDGHVAMAVAYALATSVAGLAAAALGRSLGRRARRTTPTGAPA